MTHSTEAVDLLRLLAVSGVTTPKLVHWEQTNSAPGGVGAPRGLAPEELALMRPQSTSVREIPLSRGQVALVDAADYEWLSQWRWSYGKRGYAYRRLSRTIDAHQHAIYMHHDVLPVPAGMQVDHKNHNKLDNRRANLRLATQHQQARNQPPRRGVHTSRFKGVSRHVQSSRWRARIRIDGHQISGGLFINEEDAARAYDAMAREHFGEFAWLNFPDEQGGG